MLLNGLQVLRFVETKDEAHALKEIVGFLTNAINHPWEIRWVTECGICNDLHLDRLAHILDTASGYASSDKLHRRYLAGIELFDLWQTSPRHVASVETLVPTLGVEVETAFNAAVQYVRAELIRPDTPPLEQGRFITQFISALGHKAPRCVPLMSLWNQSR